MSLTRYYHLPFVRRFRSYARKAGLTRHLHKFFTPAVAYEDAFDKAMADSIRPGDVVWDIGANVGLYTVKFLDWSSPSGQVVAFEPFGPAHEELRTKISAHRAAARCVIQRIALSDFCGEANFSADGGASGVSTTAHLADRPGGFDSPTDHRVQVMTVDALAAAARAQLPTVTKIDVEGYEEEVCAGGRVTFSRSESRHVFIEMHFSRLEERGRADAPDRIVRELRKWGYAVNWVDPSHLHACR